MDYTVEKQKGKAKFSFKLDAAEWETAVNGAYFKTKNKYQMGGFRRGKVPRKIIENLYGPSVFYEDAYAKRIKKLFYYKKQPRYKQNIDCDKDLLKGLLNFAYENKKICTVEMCDSGNGDITGYVLEVGASAVKVLSLDADGQDNGEVYASIENISRVWCDSKDEQKLEVLRR